MVFYKRAGARRVGQALNSQQPQVANMMQAPLPAQQAPMPLQQQMTMSQQAQQLSAQNNQAFNAQPADLSSLQAATNNPDLVAQQQVADATVDVATSNDGSQMFTTTIPPLGVQSTVVVTPQQPAVQQAAAVCEFPAQAVQLQRTVNITNTAPQLVNIEEDVCGNVISYTESITRQMAAGPWVPVSGLQGPIENFQDVNGIIESTDFNGNVHLANSAGPTTNPTPTIVQGPLVGGARRNVRNVAPTYNANRQYGSATLNRFRSK